MQVTRQQMTVKGGALDVAKEIVKVRKAFRELAADDEPPTEKIYQQAVKAAGLSPSANYVVDNWLRRRGKTAETPSPSQASIRQQ
jgi:hypothetical protein